MQNTRRRRETTRQKRKTLKAEAIRTVPKRKGEQKSQLKKMRKHERPVHIREKDDTVRQ